jgi:putative ABC transport system ATP-binding protein
MDKPLNPLIKLHQVHKRYRLGDTTVHALRGLSLELQRSEFAAVVGTSGSGKTTTLNMIGCIDDPDEGTVLFDGQLVRSLSDDAKCALRNQKIGFIFQTFNLVPVLDIYENVELPLLINPHIAAAERRERIMSAIQDVGLTDYARQVPDKLSGGQRQRVAIARALAIDPLLVLADEPTANLDSTTAHKIVDLMLELNQKRRVTFLFSTHDDKLMSRVARVIHLSDGVIVRDEHLDHRAA